MIPGLSVRGEGGVVHLERFEQFASEVVVEGRAACFLDHLAEPIGTDAVHEAFARISDHRSGEEAGAVAAEGVGRPGERLPALDIGIPEPVAEAGGVGEELAYRGAARGRPHPAGRGRYPTCSQWPPGHVGW
jgi:hypothetical protein